MVKKNKNIAVFAVVIVCAILVFSLIGTYPIFLKEESYPVDISTGNDVGFNMAKDKIHFGVISPGAYSERDFQLYNSAGYKVKAELGCEGDICSFVYYEKNGVLMDANSNSTVHITVRPPANIELNKTFEGNLSVKLYKRLF